jgi:broad specificity phosphatase PhoE
MEETFIYFVRHGQSTDNKQGLFHSADSDLTPLGHRQAQFVGERFKTIPVDVILTSPMQRAATTAQYIHEATEVPLETHEVLREYLAPSALLGSSMDAPEGQEYLTTMRAHYEEPGFRYADEDTYFDLFTRAQEALALLVARPEKRIAVVTHAGFMRVLLGVMLSEGEPDPHTARQLARFLAPENTGITICRYRPTETRRNKWRMLSWNDAAHLGETEKEEPGES